MSEDAREFETTIVERSSGRSLDSESNWSQEASSGDEAAVNPLTLVLNRMHGRWLWAILLAAVLAPAMGFVGYVFGPVKYETTAVLAVEARPDPLVQETLETREIKVDQEVAEQAQLLNSASVKYLAFQNPELARFESTRPNFRQTVATGIQVRVPRGSANILVSFSDADKKFAAAAVNAVIEAYFEIFQPRADSKYDATFSKIQSRIDAARRRLENLKRERITLLQDSQYAITDVQAIIDTNVEDIRRLEALIAGVEDQMDRIREDVSVRARKAAEAEGRPFDPAQVEPMADDRVEPTVQQLAEVDRELPSLEERLSRLNVEFGLVASRFGEAHPEYRNALATLEAQQRNFEARREAAANTWRQQFGRDFTWGALSARRETLAADLADQRTDNVELSMDMIKAEELDGKIASEEDELATLEARRQDLDREEDAIKKGRVDLIAAAEVPFAPSSDKTIPAAAGGAMGGIAISFGLFFLIGSLDQKTFGVRQLQDQRNSLRVLGVMPNMDEVEEESDTVTLATDCVHRVRARIEARRAPERGYAMMVSSPFQGDGKTTLAVSLGWSYAESGYKTLLLDADFIGRAMTHQFGHLKDPGLREIIRNGEVRDEIRELGHPNLCLLGVGFDRRISAANLSPRLMSRVLDAVRDRFDLIIIDSGPITASIEAMPVASSTDGVVLTLRRGRSRARLTECIEDVRSVGADYLGVVLNYAERSDCLRYGSTSRMSASVQAALEEGDGTALPDGRNPMLDDLRRRAD